MTKAMGRRMPIDVGEGKKRPNEPVQAAKLALEAGVIVRDKYPILPHWKDYKKDKLLYKKFSGNLSVSALVFICYFLYLLIISLTAILFYMNRCAWLLRPTTSRLRKLS
jgi:hypothetical protein